MKRDDIRKRLLEESKAVLAEIIIESFQIPSEAQILSVKWKLMSGEALEEMDTAIKKSAASKKDPVKWLAAHKDFDDANKKMEKADRIYEKLEKMRELSISDEAKP